MKLLQGGKKPKPDYAWLYLNAMARSMKMLNENSPKDAYYRIIFYGVSHLNHSEYDPGDEDAMQRRFDFICLIKEIIGTLTPAEFLKIFPLAKRYDGKRYQVKDFFTAMEAIQEHGLHVPMGDKALELLWEWTNPNIEEFSVDTLTLISNIRRFNGQKGVFEAFVEEQGLKLTWYSLKTDAKGRQYLIDPDTGEATRLRKKFPRYLRPVPRDAS